MVVTFDAIRWLQGNAREKEEVGNTSFRERAVILQDNLLLLLAL